MLYFLSHPIQYFSPLFVALTKKVPLKVFYYSDSTNKGSIDAGFNRNIKWDLPLLEGYDSRFLKNLRKTVSLRNSFFDVFNPEVIRLLKNSSDKIVIVNGWSYSTNWLVFIFGKVYHKDIWLRAENPLNQELKKNKLILLVKRIILKHFLFKYFIKKFLYIGSQNLQFYQYYGIKNIDKFIYTPYAVDNDRFYNDWRNFKSKSVEIKELLKLDVSKKVILYSGKYIQKKRPMDLLEAYSLLPKNEFILIFVGDGELKEDMQEYIDRNDLDYVYLTGFVNQTDISKYYTIADVFVMCSGSGETWGLSVNEAMNFGLPIVVSDTTGCSVDLVENNVNGFIYPEGDIQLLSDSIYTILTNTLLRTKMGINSQIRISKYSIKNIVNNLIEKI